MKNSFTSRLAVLFATAALAFAASAGSFTQYTLLSLGSGLTPKAVLEDSGKTLRLVYDAKDYGEEDADWFSIKTGYLQVRGYSTSSAILYGCLRETDAYLYIYSIEKIVVDSSFSAYQPTQTFGWFAGFPELTAIEGLSNFNTSKITSMYYMFADNPKLKTIDLTGVDMSKVTSMQYMFYYCPNLESVDFSGISTPLLRSVYAMFYFCYELKTIYATEGFAVKKGYSSDYVFTYDYDLVGGAGTAYGYSSKNSSFAHLDEPDNPGYFTQKSGNTPHSVLFVDGTSGSDSNEGHVYTCPKKTIAAALSAIAEGGRIYVSTGTYSPISTANKNVSIIGWERTGPVVIDGGNSQRCAYLGNSTNECATVLRRFTLRNGRVSGDSTGGGATGGAGVRGGTVEDCVISNCVVTGSWGGYGYCGGGALHSRLCGCTVVNCKALAGGGVSHSVAKRCIIRGCYAYDDGGGAWSGCLENSLLYGNTTHNVNSGSGYACANCTAYNCTMTGNSGGSGGGVVDSKLYNCIVYNNAPGNVYADGKVYLYDCYTSDPSFRDAANGDYRLALGSPCANAGNNAYVSCDVDLAGRQRIEDGTVDIGCYEMRDYFKILDFTGTATFNDNEETDWITDTNKWYAGGSSLRSPAIGDSESTSVTLTVNGAGRLTFQWNVDCDESDYFWCYVDGVARKIRSGYGYERDWQNAEIYIEGDGEHIVEWRYSKNSSYSYGQDCVWIDSLSWTPGATDPGWRSMVYSNKEWRYRIKGSIASLGSDSPDWQAVDPEPQYPCIYGSWNIPSILEGCPVKAIGDYAFYNCNRTSYSWQYDFPILYDVTSIGKSAFEGCYNLRGFAITTAVTNIGDRAFKDCSRFANITIPASVVSYGQDVLTGCSNLHEVVFYNYLPNALRFSACPKLQTIRYYGLTALPTGDYSALAGATLYVSHESTGWGCSIPGKWCGINIDYFDSLSATRLAAADFTGEGTLTDGEDAPFWMVDASKSVSGGTSIRSGKIPYSGTSTLTLTVEGKGTLSFKWKIENGSSSNRLRYYVDGVDYGAISDWTNWDEVRVDIETEGSHEIKWVYEKNSYYAYYDDCGWIDNLVWEPGEITLARDVLLWAPTIYDSYSSSTYYLIPKLLNVLEAAYGTRIPADSRFAEAYPDGINVKRVSGYSYSPAALPGNLSKYALVFVVLPYSEISSSEVMRLKTVTARGGRVVLQAEHALFSPTENARLTKLAADMGAEFSILDGQKAGVDAFNSGCNLLSNPTALTELPESKSVAPISYYGYAELVAALRDDSHYVWAVDEKSGNGRITVFSDNNWFCDSGSSSGTLYDDSIPFLERLLANAIENEKKVIDEEVVVIEEKIPDGCNVAVRDNNNLLTYYTNIWEACDYAKEDKEVTDRWTVVLKKAYYENFELPEGVTFETTSVTSNYTDYATISAPSQCEITTNATHDIFRSVSASAPEAPVVSASDGTYTNKIVVTWTVPESDKPITSYTIQRKRADNGFAQDPVTVTTNQYVDTDARAGVRYNYFVYATSSAGNGKTGSDEGYRNASGQVPDPVLSVEATGGTATNGVVVTWQPDTNTAITVTKYELRRREDGSSNWTTISSTIDPEATSYTDASATPGKDYVYSVRVGNEYGWSDSVESSDSGWLPAILSVDPTSFTVPFEGATQSVAVVANTGWAVTSIVGNVTATKVSQDELSVEVPVNPSQTAQTNTVTLVAGGDHPVYATVTVIQQRQPKLTGLEITPEKVVFEGGEGTNYIAIAHYDDGTERNVTSNVTWLISENGYGTITNGVLTTSESTDTNRTATITATLTQEGDETVTVTDTSDVTIKFTSRLRRPMSLTINGDDTISAGATNAYTATVAYNDGTTVEKTLEAAWSLTPSGTVAQVVKGDENVKLTAAWTATGTLELKAAYSESCAALGGLVAWYKLDGNGRDSSAYGNHAVEHGVTPTTDHNGKENGAYYFNGSTYLEAPDHYALYSVTNVISVSAWMKPTGSMSGWQYAFCKSTVHDIRQYGLGISGSRFYIMDGDASVYSKYGDLGPLWTDASMTLVQGEWHHVMITYDGSVIRAYRDAVLVGSKSVTGHFVDAPGGVLIGYDPPGEEEWFTGALSDIRIYNRALTDAQVATVYAGGVVADSGSESVAVVGTKTITVKPMPVLTGIEILGPSELEGGATSNFTALAHYDDGSSNVVTAAATWSVAKGSEYGAVGERTGVLSTHETTDLDGALTLRVSFSADLPTPVTVTADKTVRIGFTRALLAPVSLWVTGPTAGSLGVAVEYRATVAFNNATTNEVTLDASTKWSVTPENRVEPRRTDAAFSVTPRAPAVTNTVSASYTYGSNTVSGSLSLAVPEIVSLPIAVDLEDADISTGGLFRVIQYNLKSSPKTIGACERAIVSPSTWTTAPVTGNYESISFENGTSCTGRSPYLHAVSFPGNIDGKHEYFACLITGKMLIPEAGDWTFACDIDDGFQFELTGQGATYLFKQDGIGALRMLLRTFHIAKAGVYDIRAVFYEQGGYAALSMGAAKGKHTTFSTSVFKVIGTAESEIKVLPAKKISDLELATGGVNGWYGQLAVNSDGVDAGQSGYIPGAGESWMSTTVTNAGTLTFTWKASSEPVFDTLSFTIDGERKASVSGTDNDWRTLTFEIPSGTHDLRWTYAKDGGSSAGDDAAWVDRIVWTPIEPPDVVLDVTATDGTSSDETLVTWNATASGQSGTAYEVRRAVRGTTDWEVLVSDHAALTYHDTTAAPGVEYTYCVRAGNIAGWGPSALDDGWRACTLAFDPDEITFAHTGGSNDVAVAANADWTFSKSADWFTIASPDEDALHVEACPNLDFSSRTGTITVVVGEATLHAVTGTVTVIQEACPPRIDVAFEKPDELWRTKMQLATNTTPDGVYAPVSVFPAGAPLDISFGWTNRSEIAVSLPAIRWRVYEASTNSVIAEWITTGRDDEKLESGEGAWSGDWPCDILKVLAPGDYMLEGEIGPAPDYNDVNRTNGDNVAVFRFAIRNDSLGLVEDVFASPVWTNVEAKAGNDFAQGPHAAVRTVVLSNGTEVVMPAVQFGPYVPMNGVKVTGGGRKALDLVLLVDDSISMTMGINGLVNNISVMVDQLLRGDAENAPIDDLRIKVVGYYDYMDYDFYAGTSRSVTRPWFKEYAFSTDPDTLKQQLTVLRNGCSGGSANDGESSFDALYYLCKGWTQNTFVGKPLGHQPTEYGFRDTTNATRVVILFTDEPPHCLPYEDKNNRECNVPGCEDLTVAKMDAALREAGVHLMIVGDGLYQGDMGTYTNGHKYRDLVDLDPDTRSLEEPEEADRVRGALAKMTGDADFIRNLATKVSQRVVTQVTKIEPTLSVTTKGRGTFSFCWKNDSTAGEKNTFSFVCDGITNVANAAGSGWHRESLYLAAGSHVFRWSYGKVDYEGTVTDCGIVGDIAWEPEPTKLELRPTLIEVDHPGARTLYSETGATVVGGGDTNVAVTCNSIWKVVTNSVPNWISFVAYEGTDDGEIVFQVATNDTFKTRRAEITVRAGEYGLPTDDIVEKTFKVVQGPSVPVSTDDPQILTVDVKPRWPWNDKVDIDFMVALPKDNAPLKVTFRGVNHEGEGIGYDISTLTKAKYCDPSATYVSGNEVAAGTTYAVCPTSGWYRVTWQMGYDWYNRYSTVWKRKDCFHTPDFAAELTAQRRTGSGIMTTVESNRVRVDVRQDDGSGGFVMTGTEMVGHPDGDVDPVPFDTTALPAGWNSLASISNVWADVLEIDRQLPDAYTNSEYACVLNDATNFPVVVEGGVISTSTTWRADKVHLVRDNVFVASNAVLTIEDGAIVKFCYCTRMYIFRNPNITKDCAERYNIRVKGAYMTGATDTTYGGDTLFGCKAADETSGQFATDHITSQDFVARIGQSLNSAVLNVSLMKDVNSSGESGTFKHRFYTYDENWGDMPYPSADGFEFYGWFKSLKGTLTVEEYKNGYIADGVRQMVSYDENAHDSASTRAYWQLFPLLKPKDWTDSVWPKMNGGDGVIALDSYEATYDGAVHKPSVTLVTVHDSKIDTNNYEIVYGDGNWTDIGTYPVRVNFLVDYTNSPVAYFTIRPGEVAGGSAVFSPAEMRYVKSKFGAVAEPVPTVRLADGTVIPPSSYTVNWLGDRTWPSAGTWTPGTYTAEIRFGANFTGTLTNTFTIVSNPDYYFTEYGTKEDALAHVGLRTDESVKRKRILYIGGTTNDLMTAYVLKQIHDDLELNELIIDNFVVWTEDPTADGSSFEAFSEGLSVKAQPLFAVLSEHDLTRPLAGLAGYHTNERLRAFLEEALALPDDASSATLALSSDAFAYTGTAVHPTGTVTYDGETVPPENYTLEYADGCTELGGYWVKAVFKPTSTYGGYGLTGETARVSFSVVSRVLKASDVSLSPASAVYDGSVHRPDVILPSGVGYNVDYGLGYYVATGDYTIAVTSTEPTYTGRVEKTFTIVARDVSSDVTVTLSQDSISYSGCKALTSAVRPSVTRVESKDGKRGYTEGTDYDVSYGSGSWMTNGIYDVVITFKNGYTGTVTVPFKITIEQTGLPQLPDDPTENDVANALATVAWSDPSVTTRIRTVEEYERFNTWYTNMIVTADKTTVDGSANAYTSFVVSELTGNNQILTHEQVAELSLEITSVEITPSGDANKVGITVVLKEGDEELQLVAASAAFANLVRRSNSLADLKKDSSKPDPSEVKVEKGDEPTRVRLSIDIPKGDSGFLMLIL